LAQFADNNAPFNTLEGLAIWAQKLGFVGVQIPTWDSRLFDLEAAAESQAYCDEILGVLQEAGVELTELSTHLQGQLVASHTAYDTLLEGFAPKELAGNPKEAQAWAVQQLEWAAKASRNLGLNAHATFSGALAWPFFYPWPQRPAGRTLRDRIGPRTALTKSRLGQPCQIHLGGKSPLRPACFGASQVVRRCRPAWIGPATISPAPAG